jgi:hypothetical protein
MPPADERGSGDVLQSGSQPPVQSGSITNDDGANATIQLANQIVGRFLVVALPLIVFVGPAAAQSEVGNTLCGTPIAEFINGVVPLVVGLAMIVGAVFAAFMHARAGVARDAEQARFYLDWRNRAGYTAVTAPLLAFIIQMLIGFTGTGVASCVNLVPFF